MSDRKISVLVATWIAYVFAAVMVAFAVAYISAAVWLVWWLLTVFADAASRLV